MNADLHERDWDVFADPDYAPHDCDHEPGPDLSLLRTDYDAWLTALDTPSVWSLDEIAHRILDLIRLEAVGEATGNTVPLEMLALSALEMAHIAKIVAERAPRWVMVGRRADDKGP